MEKEWSDIIKDNEKIEKIAYQLALKIYNYKTKVFCKDCYFKEIEDEKVREGDFKQWYRRNKNSFDSNNLIDNVKMKSLYEIGKIDIKKVNNTYFIICNRCCREIQYDILD